MEVTCRPICTMNLILHCVIGVNYTIYDNTNNIIILELLSLGICIVRLLVIVLAVACMVF